MTAKGWEFWRNARRPCVTRPLGPLLVFSLGCAPAAQDGASDGEFGALSCRAVELVVGWGIGGGTDLFARSIAPAASEALGIPVKVLNVPGASSILAMEEVLARPADGCTVLAVTSDQVTNEAVGLTERSLLDMTPLMRAHLDMGTLSASAGGPVESWTDVAAVSDRGETVLVGGAGAAGFDELVVAMILETAGVRYRYIPYESAAAMHADLLGGRLHMIYEEASIVTPMMREGRVLPVLVLAQSHVNAIPAPAWGELGHEVPPGLWRGLAVHGETPDPVASELERAFLQAVRSNAHNEFVRRRLLDLVPGLLAGDAFRATLQDELERFRRAAGHETRNTTNQGDE